MAAAEARAWQFLQAGDLKTAERELSVALKAAPAFFPAETALGYVELARKDAKAALPHFDTALQQQPAYPSALVGKGQALVALGREADAVAAFEAAVAADPSLTDIKRRVEVLKFRGVEQQSGRGAPGRARRHAPTRRSAVIRPRSRARRTARSCIASSRPSSVSAARPMPRSSISAGPSRSIRPTRKSLQQIGEILESRGRSRAGGEGVCATRWPIEPNADVERRLDASSRADGAGAPAGRVPRDRGGDARSRAAISRRSSASGSRRCCRRSRGPMPCSSPTSARTGRPPGSWPSRAPASWSRSPITRFSRAPSSGASISRRRSRACFRASPPRVRAKASAWESARVKFTDLVAGASRVPGGVGRRGRRRDEDGS